MYVCLAMNCLHFGIPVLELLDHETMIHISLIMSVTAEQEMSQFHYQDKTVNAVLQLV